MLSKPGATICTKLWGGGGPNRSSTRILVRGILNWKTMFYYQ